MNKQQHKEHIKRMMKIVDATISFTTEDRSMDFESYSIHDYDMFRQMYEMAVNQIKNSYVDA